MGEAGLEVLGGKGFEMCVFFMAYVIWRFGLEGEKRGHRVNMDTAIFSQDQARTLAAAKVLVGED